MISSIRYNEIDSTPDYKMRAKSDRSFGGATGALTGSNVAMNFMSQEPVSSNQYSLTELQKALK